MDFSNFEEYYRDRNYCVLPAITLFKLVKHVLDGNKLDIKKFEQVLLGLGCPLDEFVL